MLEATVSRAGMSPIKGTRHLELASISFDADGVVGDRRFCLVDVERRRVLRTVQHPELVAVVAAERDGDLSLTVPGHGSLVGRPEPSGATITCDYWGRTVELDLLDGPHAGLLSAYLGVPVRLAAAPPGGVIYGAGVSVITRASLDDLAERCGHPIDPARFRASLVLEGGADESEWPGRDLRVGDAVLRVGGPIGRCAVIDIDPVTGNRGTALLRTLAGYRPRNEVGEPCFGLYAQVVVPGVLRVI